MVKNHFAIEIVPMMKPIESIRFPMCILRQSEILAMKNNTMLEIPMELRRCYIFFKNKNEFMLFYENFLNSHVNSHVLLGEKIVKWKKFNTIELSIKLNPCLKLHWTLLFSFIPSPVVCLKSPPIWYLISTFQIVYDKAFKTLLVGLLN